MLIILKVKVLRCAKIKEFTLSRFLNNASKDRHNLFSKEGANKFLI